jgi:8-amino-7-oxononanoate synthase
MNRLQQHWLDQLEARKAQGNYRQLRSQETGADFYSNDYLGLARDPVLQQHIADLVAARPECLMGATGSRLISGTSGLCQEVEAFIAATHKADAALVFPSGYKANLALFSCVAGRGDTILVDELIHRSVHDGCALSAATKWKFRHNDMEHLETLLQRAKGNVFIAVETLYSMDGDVAPLREIVALAKRYGAQVIADEAHAAGVFGKGLVATTALQDEILATVITYGKAFGLQGAAIVGSQLLKDYLVNYAAPFIYSTAMPDIQLLSIKAAYEHLEQRPGLKEDLLRNISLFKAYGVSDTSAKDSPVQVVRFPDEVLLKRATAALKAANCLVYAVYAPTVKQGSERLRICLHRFNTAQEITTLCGIINIYRNG